MTKKVVHQYKNNGYNIVLDVCSGSVHVVDDLVYDMIAMYKDKKFEEIEQAILEKYEIPIVRKISRMRIPTFPS